MTSSNFYFYQPLTLHHYKCSHSYLSMADLLKKLVSQAKQEGREDLRQLVAALNGQAAVYIIMRQVGGT